MTMWNVVERIRSASAIGKDTQGYCVALCKWVSERVRDDSLYPIPTLTLPFKGRERFWSGPPV